MNRKGVTLVELLMTLVISAIALFALTIPFVADRTFWASGEAQAEAQRDAEMVMRAIARVARGSSAYNTPSADELAFQVPSCGTSTFHHEGSAFHLHDCAGGPAVVLIDGVRSQMPDPGDFLVTPIILNRLVTVRLRIIHQNREDEVLESSIFLRNGS